MDETDRRDADALIASLRAAGADRFDPVRLHYIEVLAQRSRAHHGDIRGLLDARLARAVAAFNERFEQARSEAGDAIARCVSHHPQAAGELQRLLATGDIKGVRRLIASLQAGEQTASLGALVRRLDHTPGHADAHPAGNAGALSELKTIRNFRNTWSKLSVDKQVARALGQAPANAGPINSHMLVLRSLALMREISPDYLNRFMSYTDTLLRLDQGEKERAGNPKKPPAAKTAKTAKTVKTVKTAKKSG